MVSSDGDTLCTDARLAPVDLMMFAVLWEVLWTASVETYEWPPKDVPSRCQNIVLFEEQDCEERVCSEHHWRTAEPLKCLRRASQHPGLSI